MMISVPLKSETDIEAWRTHARSLCAKRVAPSDIVWQSPSAAPSLFSDHGAKLEAPAVSPDDQPVRVPRGFVSLASRVMCHRDPARFARLYRLLYRLQAVPKLLDNPIDEDVAWCANRDKAVRRDRHKMHAFVRFRKVDETDGRERYAAWFEPTHRITELAAPFFVRRFPNMDWVILTPDRSAIWQDNTLTFHDGACREDAPQDDAVEAEWEVYFASIFNPARLKVNAMTAEMPKKYWRNLPEAKLIPDLIAQAQGRTNVMQASAVTEAHPRAAKVRARIGTERSDQPE